MLDALFDEQQDSFGTGAAPGVPTLSPEELESMKGGLPGGVDPSAVFQLMNEPEVMAMMQKPKFQEIMAAVMGGGGQEAVQAQMADPEARQMMMTLTRLLQKSGMPIGDRVDTSPVIEMD